jgi:hypothetical protein
MFYNPVSRLSSSSILPVLDRNLKEPSYTAGGNAS